MKFNSQICTTRLQSEHLLALGLKPETADMWYPHFAKTCPLPLVDETLASDDIPAWSLHMLLSMLPDDAPKIFWILDGASITIVFEDDDSDFFPHKGDIYEGVVNCIEWLIKEGYFNKEYLV